MHHPWRLRAGSGRRCLASGIALSGGSHSTVKRTIGCWSTASGSLYDLVVISVALFSRSPFLRSIKLICSDSCRPRGTAGRLTDKAWAVDGQYSIVNRHAQTPRPLGYFGRTVMHDVSVGGVLVALKEHQPVQRRGVRGVLARVLILGSWPELSRDQAHVNEVAVELRA